MLGHNTSNDVSKRNGMPNTILSKLMEAIDSPIVDYKFFGSHITGIYFSDRNVQGNDKFLSSLALPDTSYPPQEWIKNSINLFLVTGEITEEFKLHFSAPLKVIRILRINAQRFPDENWESKLDDFEFGFKLSLTHIIDQFRLFFEEAYPIYRQWENKRESYSNSDLQWIDDQYYDNLITIVDKQFSSTIDNFHSFLEFGSKLFFECKFLNTYLIGDGFLVSKSKTPGDGLSQCELLHVSEDEVLQDLDYFPDGADACVTFSDSDCSFLHDHIDSKNIIRMAIPKGFIDSVV